MSKECFNLLCERINASVGESEFKTENYIDSLYQDCVCTHPYLTAHQIRNNGIICGEIKLAIILRLIARASYLDLFLLYGISYQHRYTIFHHVNSKWICNDNVSSIQFHQNLEDEESVLNTSQEFVNGASGGFFKDVLEQ